LLFLCALEVDRTKSFEMMTGVSANAAAAYVIWRRVAAVVVVASKSRATTLTDIRERQAPLMLHMFLWWRGQRGDVSKLDVSEQEWLPEISLVSIKFCTLFLSS
jgi:hypothetical protein